MSCSNLHQFFKVEIKLGFHRMIYLSNLLFGRIWHIVILLWGSHARIQTHALPSQKCLILSSFLNYGVSGAKSWTQPCIVGIAERTAPRDHMFSFPSGRLKDSTANRYSLNDDIKYLSHLKWRTTVSRQIWRDWDR